MQDPEMGRTTVSGQDLAVTQMNPQYLGLPTQDLHKIKRIPSFSTEEGSPPLPSPQWPTSEELMAAEGEVIFLWRGEICHWVSVNDTPPTHTHQLRLH